MRARSGKGNGNVGRFKAEFRSESTGEDSRGVGSEPMVAVIESIFMAIRKKQGNRG